MRTGGEIGKNFYINHLTHFHFEIHVFFGKNCADCEKNSTLTAKVNQIQRMIQFNVRNYIAFS